MNTRKEVDDRQCCQDPDVRKALKHEWTIADWKSCALSMAPLSDETARMSLVHFACDGPDSLQMVVANVRLVRGLSAENI